MMIRFSEAFQDWQPIPPWVRFFLSFGYEWPREKTKPRRICLISMPCDSASAGLVALGAMVRDLGDPQANDVDSHYDRLLDYARQFLKFCKHCDMPCHPELKQCGYEIQATGRLRSQSLRGTVEISDETDFYARKLKWIRRTGRKTHCVVTPTPEHTGAYQVDGEPPSQWNDAAGGLPHWPYQGLFDGATIIPENLRRSYSGLCFAGRIAGEAGSKEVCDQVRFTDGNCIHSLRQLIAIHNWSDNQISRMVYFNSRTQKLDRYAAPPNLVVADGDIAFLRACDHTKFQNCDVIGVIHRTIERDRLEAVGIKIQPSLWFAPDTDTLCGLPSIPRGISIAALKARYYQ